MRRREFLSSCIASTGAALGLSGTRLAAQDPSPVPARPAKFRLKYAPPLNMFRAHAQDPVDRIKFAHDQGFRAIEDNRMKTRPIAVQEAIRKALDQLGMEMGVFVAHSEWDQPDFASQDQSRIDAVLADMRSSVDVARRVGARWCTVVPGRINQKLAPGFQNAYAIDNLRRCCEILEPANLTMVLEPLNPWRDHPGMFLQTIPHAFELCRAVDSPSCKILFDMYHQQITEGNLIPNIDRAWSEVAYFQIGDNPGRKEPTTGEINYKNVFRHIHQKGYDGILGMEHGKSKGGKAGELAVIAAYRECDSFE